MKRSKRASDRDWVGLFFGGFGLVACRNGAEPKPVPHLDIVVGAPTPSVEIAELDPDGGAASPTDLHVPPKLAAKISTGLTVNIVVEVEVTTLDGTSKRLPAGTCSVTFDVRDEVYRLRVPSKASDARAMAVVTLDGLVRRCTDREAYQAIIAGHSRGTTMRRTVREQ
jgi:hypothetical protein